MEVGGVVQQVESLQLPRLGLVQLPNLLGGDLAHLQLIQQLPASVCWADINDLAGNVAVAGPFAGLEIALIPIRSRVRIGLQIEGQPLVPEVTQFLQPVQHRHSGR